MEKLKTCGLALALCGAVLQNAAADTRLYFAVDKLHYFTGTVTSRFAGGDLFVLMQDGTIQYQLCYGAQSFPFPVPIDPLACPLGSTGFVAAGDLNGDGVQDDLTYWSVVTPIPAAAIEPFRADAVALIGRPSRQLPLLQNFKDVSTIVYWNLMDPANFAQYNISGYSIQRDYAGAADQTAQNGAGDLQRMNNELTTGQYIFTFPGLKRTPTDPDSLVNLGVNFTANVEALDVTSRYRSGFYFTNATWDEDFFYQMDPRKTVNIKWTGNSSTLIRTGDLLYFAMLNKDGATVEYPSPYYPTNFLKLTLPTVTSYTLPPLFFAVGDEKEMSLQFRRTAATNANIYDVSLRDFRAKVRMVDSYAGFAALYFPQGTPTAKIKPTVDYDGDGVTNITEFAAEYPTTEQVSLEARDEDVLPTYTFDDQGNPILYRKVTALVFPNNAPNQNLHPAANPAAPVKNLEVHTSVDAEGYIVCDVVKRPFSGTSLIPQFEMQIPGGTPTSPRYKKLTVGKDWTLTDRITDDPAPVNVDVMVSVQSLVTGAVAPAAPRTITINLFKTYWRFKSTTPIGDPANPPVFRVTVKDNPLKS